MFENFYNETSTCKPANPKSPPMASLHIQKTGRTLAWWSELWVVRLLHPLPHTLPSPSHTPLPQHWPSRLVPCSLWCWLFSLSMAPPQSSPPTCLCSIPTSSLGSRQRKGNCLSLIVLIMPFIFYILKCLWYAGQPTRVRSPPTSFCQVPILSDTIPCPKSPRAR